MGPTVVDDRHPLHTPALLDAVIGPCAVAWWDGHMFVVRVDPSDHRRVLRILHTLKPGQNPLDALYGKPYFCDAAVQEAYRKRNEAKRSVLEREDADLSKDTERGLWRVWNKQDGPEALHSYFRPRPQRRRPGGGRAAQ